MKYFDSLKITIASPDDIKKWSHGEIIKPETINYRTQRPEKDGLFSERIFGPTKDYECYCGKYRRIRYKGITCDKCGVEVTRAIVRRERMGHIELATPVCHIWFFKNVPSKLGLILDLSTSKLEKVVYYAAYIVTKIDEANREKAIEDINKELKERRNQDGQDKESIKALEEAAQNTKENLELLRVGEVISEVAYFDLARKFGNVFEAGTGGESIRKILVGMNLDDEIEKIEKSLEGLRDATKKIKLFKRLKIVMAMKKNNLRPEWMIMSHLPVLPPDLRPMVPLDGGRYATSDLNDLYRRVINRNNRLKKLMELKAPEVIVTNEKRMLQEAVDALIDNSARTGSTQQMSSSRRPLRSLSDMLKGKQGRFRQNLLGKRVDYSGRSVIVVGPSLHLHECGLPKKMALELFKPFVISKIIERELAHNIRNANRLIEQASPEVWSILEEVIESKRVLLNRAPTLHRMSVQAFKPVLTENFAIQVPPLVCKAFNADFDGDQMAVHLPLSDEAQTEARERMLSSANLLLPANGEPVVHPTLDMILGIYYLTKIKPDAKGANTVFSSNYEALVSMDFGYTALNAPIKIGSPKNEETSCGRIIFNKILPAGHEVNKTLKKKDLAKIIEGVTEEFGFEKTAEVIDEMKVLGFKYATKSGISWAMSDLIIPKEKAGIMAEAETKVEKIEDQLAEGLMTPAEKKAKSIAVWNDVKNQISEIIPNMIDEFGSVFYIIDSGSRGSWMQPIQMMGIKGHVASPKGDAIELPIKSSLKEGFKVLEYFISTHGSRKGLADTALKTAQAGYLTRRLVDVSQDVIIREKDCRTKESIEINRKDGEDFGQTFTSRLYSRTVASDVKDGDKVIIKAGTPIGRDEIKLIEELENIESVSVRSPMTCKSLYGICSKCYGLDLANSRDIEIGEAVGVIAAQSIGEPGTQLTLKTFHLLGSAGADITHGLPRVEELFEVRSPKGKAIIAEGDGIVEEIREEDFMRTIIFKITEGKKAKVVEYPVHRTIKIFVKEGQTLEKGDQITEGHIDLKELLKYKGPHEVQRYIINEIQKIYTSEGAPINNKHIECVIRQMFSRVKITESGDSDFLLGDIVDKSRFVEANRKIKKEGGTPAKSQQLLMGITKVSLSSDSFLSAASFQETAKNLVNAAVVGKVDHLRGLKENVIIGRLIPVGTGFKKHEEGFLEEDFATDSEDES